MARCAAAGVVAVTDGVDVGDGDGGGVGGSVGAADSVLHDSSSSKVHERGGSPMPGDSVGCGGSAMLGSEVGSLDAMRFTLLGLARTS